MVVKLEILVPAGTLAYEKKKLKKILKQAGQDIAAEARKLIRKAMPGKNGRSKPGEAPVSQTGLLAKSIRVKSRRGGMGVSVKDSVFYAKFLETGAVGGGGGKNSKTKGRQHKAGGAKGLPQTPRVMAPRPFLSQALDRKKSEITARIAESISKDIEFKQTRRK